MRRMEKEEAAMRAIYDLMEKILFVVILVCGIIALITLTSAFVFFMVQAIIEVATNGINGI